jgi:peptidoglycan hydrolase-like protein with peptidoglycan-binding domain
MQRQLLIGNLNPAKDTDDEGVSGIQSRLRNLGYSPGKVDGIYGPRTAAAIAAFQHDNKLEVDGKISDALVSKLEELHGS